MVLLVLASTVLMLLGMVGLESGFYTTLRVVVCLTAVVGFVAARRTGAESWAWVFGVIAVVYNPLVPVYLHSRGLWSIVNLVTIALFWNGLRATRTPARAA